MENDQTITCNLSEEDKEVVNYLAGGIARWVKKKCNNCDSNWYNSNFLFEFDISF